MTKRIDLVGKRFGRLEVLSYSHTNKDGRALWNCQCDCGNSKTIRGGDLRLGKSLSCKCLNYEVSSTHKLSGTKIYVVWQNMNNRCYKEYTRMYKHYGGRGINVCDNWLTFEGFYSDMGSSYKEGLSIDRIDVNGNYELSNCKWSTRREQNNNRRDTIYLTVNGIKDSLANLCRTYEVNYDYAKDRVKLGWDSDKIFSI